MENENILAEAVKVEKGGGNFATKQFVLVHSS